MKAYSAYLTRHQVLRVFNQLFARPEVDYFQVAVQRFRVEQNVLRLQVSVHYSLLVAVLNRRQDLLQVVGCHFLAKGVQFLEPLEQLAPGAVLGY